MRKILLLSLVLLASLATRANHWTPNPYQFPDNMNVIAIIEINGEEQTNTNLELGAFYGDECRGSEMLAYYANLDRCLVFLTLYGEYGHQFYFRLYDHGTQQEYDFECANTITFVSNQIIGGLFDPYAFSFTGDIFNVSVVTVPEEGGSVTGAGMYMTNDLCTLTAMPNPGFHFDQWREDGATLSTETEFSFNVVADRSIEAVFTQESYTITATASPTEGGHVEGAGEYQYGELALLQATAEPNYSFESWQENGQVVSSEPDYQFVVESDRDLVAVFVHDEYQIEVEVAPENGGTVVGAGTYEAGSLCTLEATENAGYYFVYWVEDGTVVGEELTLSFTVDADRYLVAYFERFVCHIDVTVEPEEGGTVTGDDVYFYGETALLQATAAPNFYFIHWEEDGEVVSTNASYEFVVEGDRNLKAVFAIDAYLVEAEAEPAEGGIIYGAGYYINGTLCTLQAVARNGYAFVNWTEDDVVVSDEPTFSFNVVDNQSFVAHFEHVVYHITVTADPAEGGEVMGGGDFYYGETCEVDALPAYNYSFDRWKENGGTISIEQNYSFTVIRDRDLVANFVYYDGVEDVPNDGCYAICQNYQIIVTNQEGEKIVPKQVVDIQGRIVNNSWLKSGIYLVEINGCMRKVVVE